MPASPRRIRSALARVAGTADGLSVDVGDPAPNAVPDANADRSAQHDMRVFVLDLPHGDDLIQALHKWAADESVQQACVLSCVGMVSQITLKPFAGAEPVVLDQRAAFQILSLSGRLSVPGSANGQSTLLQLSVSDASCRVFGGVAHEGCIVHGAVEVCVGVLHDASEPSDRGNGPTAAAVAAVAAEGAAFPPVGLRRSMFIRRLAANGIARAGGGSEGADVEAGDGEGGGTGEEEEEEDGDDGDHPAIPELMEDWSMEAAAPAVLSPGADSPPQTPNKGSSPSTPSAGQASGVTAGGAMRDDGLHRMRGQKLNGDGAYIPFHGVSVVWPLIGTACRPPADPAHACRPDEWRATEPPSVWRGLPSIVAKAAGAAYAPLPSCSYHITLLDGITAEQAIGEQAPPQFQRNHAWRNYLRLRGARLKRANALLGFDPEAAVRASSAAHAAHAATDGDGGYGGDGLIQSAPAGGGAAAAAPTAGVAPFVPRLVFTDIEVAAWGICARFALASPTEERAAECLTRPSCGRWGGRTGARTPSTSHSPTAFRARLRVQRRPSRRCERRWRRRCCAPWSPPCQGAAGAAAVTAFPDMQSFPPWCADPRAMAPPPEHVRAPPPLRAPPPPPPPPAAAPAPGSSRPGGGKPGGGGKPAAARRRQARRRRRREQVVQAGGQGIPGAARARGVPPLILWLGEQPLRARLRLQPPPAQGMGHDAGQRLRGV